MRSLFSGPIYEEGKKVGQTSFLGEEGQEQKYLTSSELRGVEALIATAHDDELSISISGIYTSN